MKLTKRSLFDGYGTETQRGLQCRDGYVRYPHAMMTTELIV